MDGNIRSIHPNRLRGVIRKLCHLDITSQRALQVEVLPNSKKATQQSSMLIRYAAKLVMGERLRNSTLSDWPVWLYI